nr:beta-alanyl-dopamine hydrolase [Ischnura senegalensis]
MPTLEEIGRRNSIPVLYTRGTHYEVGYDVGRTFRGLIQSFLSISVPLNTTYLPLYETDEGLHAYETTLAIVKENFPQYVRELQGIAEGAQVPFHKLFLLHMDDILPNSLGKKCKEDTSGCSTIVVNQPGQEFLGHTEDALPEVLNHIYFVSAHIISDEPEGRWKVTEEKFTSLCYAGHLPGFTMNYNHHGLVFSVNIISAKKLISGKTPRHFLMRALLAAENMSMAQQILRDEGVGAGDAVSVNMTFLNQDGNRLFHNAEVGPAIIGESPPRSQLNILTASQGESFFHCNKYLRLNVPEVDTMIITSSDRRHAVVDSRSSPPENKEDVINIMGDQSDGEYCIFREGKTDDFVKTVAVGIFDCVEKTWSIYSSNPKETEPIVVFPLLMKPKEE